MGATGTAGALHVDVEDVLFPAPFSREEYFRFLTQYLPSEPEKVPPLVIVLPSLKVYLVRVRSGHDFLKVDPGACLYLVPDLAREGMWWVT